MFSSSLPSGLPLFKDITIYKNNQSNRISDEKCYISQWYSTNHKAFLYTQHNKILAVVKDLSEKAIMVSSENIKGGINGKIPQDVLFKMIECDQDRISLTLHKNRNNHFTLWIIPKLEGSRHNR